MKGHTKTLRTRQTEEGNMAKKIPGPFFAPFLFLSMIMVQGFFSGLIAGQIGSDSMAVGIKHSMIMLLSGFVIFMVVVKTGLV